jgi:hypothetical protein
MVLERYGEFVAHDKRKELEGAQAQLAEALGRSDSKDGQKQGQEALNHLTHVLEDLGPAGRLLMVDRVMQQVAPATAGYLATQAKDLKDALRDENAARVQEIQNSLDLTLRQIAESIPVGANIGTGGLLEEIETLPESSGATT